MANKALITRRGTPGGTEDVLRAATTRDAEGAGVQVEHQLPQGTLISGAEDQYAELERQGFRVKLLPDTNILEIGPYRIDTEVGGPDVPAALRVPAGEAGAWTHHLVQLSGPPTEEWVHIIEARGVDVVEAVSAYGLFVVGDPAAVAALDDLDFVVWTGVFEPAYRVASALLEMSGRIRYVNIGVYPESDVPAVRTAIEAAGGRVADEWGQEGR
jgi:hypothetical protein